MDDFEGVQCRYTLIDVCAEFLSIDLYLIQEFAAFHFELNAFFIDNNLKVL